MNKAPKGTIDLYDQSYDLVDGYLASLKDLFKSYGGIGLDTPVFEIRENLMGKYGEEAENKLVFNLEETKGEDGEKYTLRYDLTVPKMRFILQNNIKKSRIYSIGKVYRRDQPSKGRFREFYQADFDIVGEETLTSEVFLLKLADEFLNKINIKRDQYTILINDTNYLREILVNKLGIDEKNFKNVCSSIDKLDKCEFSEIANELRQKGVNNLEELEKLLSNVVDVPNSIQLVKSYADVFGFSDNIQFTPNLARGLDYYNGIIYEIKLKNGFQSTIISGGRYDGAIKNRSLVGISFGVSRIASLQELSNDWSDQYYLYTMESDILTKLKVLARCEKALKRNIIFYDEDRKLTKAIQSCIQKRIRFIVLATPDELASDTIIVKDLRDNTQTSVTL
jgi:histidyl-tRNA synthetase